VPGVEQIESLFGFAAMAGFLAMDVEAVGTAVDLRSAHFNELNRALFQAALLDISLDPLHRAHRVGCRLIGVQTSSFDRDSPCFPNPHETQRCYQ
jgi:hypothetical protein